ncbi:MAG: hypothetical protein OD814_001178 [Candidatus Alkanophagales archaeon MCA70_species_1]|nr:hypothetical protein [Candidatus Alkanophaga volatiphilum]
MGIDFYPNAKLKVMGEGKKGKKKYVTPELRPVEGMSEKKLVSDEIDIMVMLHAVFSF